MTESEEDIIWLRPEKPLRGKAPSYSRADIAAAAVRIADAEGLDAVSMRKVAGEVGAGTMSLYRYVRSKEELIALMVDAISAQDAEQPWPEAGDDWTGVLRDCARGSRQAVLDHSWFPVAAAMVRTPGPNMLKLMERVMAALDRPELGADELFQIVLSVNTFAQGYAQNEIAEIAAGIGPGPAEDRTDESERAYLNWMASSGEYPYLSRMIEEAQTPHQDADDQFDAMLDWLIQGIAARIESRAAAGRHG